MFVIKWKHPKANEVLSMKKIPAFLLALCLLFGLCACTNTEIRAVDDGMSAQPAAEAAQSFDWDAAFAAFAPDEVVFTVGESAVTWRELFYQVAYCTAAIESNSGTAVTDWDMTMYDDAGNLTTCGDYVLQMAVSLLTQYHVVYDRLTAAGLRLSEEGQAQVEAYRQSMIKEYFAGDEAAFGAYLDSLYCTEELWNWFSEVDVLYNEGFAYLYGENGAALSPEEILAYAGDYGYVTVKQIYIYNNSETLSDSAEPGEDPMTRMLTELSPLKADPAALESCFDALAAQYNENLALNNYPRGWCIYEGDTEDAVYRAALEMQDYEYGIVSLEEADVLLLRLPVEPEADVFYDADGGVMYSLRYYAAWQAYSDAINGPDGWIMSTETLPVSRFEEFMLQDIF